MAATRQFPEKPLLRGWSHAVAAAGAVVFTAALASRCLDDPPRLASMLVYGLSMVAMFTGSAIYHVRIWPEPRRALLRRLDHGNIFLMIAGTSTPICLNVLAGWERLAMLGLIWTLAIIGLLLTVITSRLSRRIRAALYTGIGLANVLAAPALVTSLPAVVILSAIGGLLYIVGAVIYAGRRPDPLPRTFGYHELFHLFVIAASMAFGAAIWGWVVPFPRS